MARLTALLIPPLVRKKPSAEPTKTSNLSLIISMSSGAYHGPPWLVMYGNEGLQPVLRHRTRTQTCSGPFNSIHRQPGSRSRRGP